MRRENPLTLGSSGYSDRVLRLFAIFVACGYLIYFVLLYPRLADEAARLDSWWLPFGLTLVYGPPLLLCSTAFFAELRTLRRTAGAVALCYFVAAFTWPLAWQGESMPEWPFVSTVPGLAAMAAALVWRPSWVMIYTVVVVSEVQVLGITRAPEVNEPFWMGWIYATSFCVVYVAATLRAVRTGQTLDDARAEAVRLSAEAEAVLVYNDDREQFANVVHDNVMHCLRIGMAGKFSARDAGEALRALDDIGAKSGDEPFSGDEVIDYLREKLQSLDEVEETSTLVVENGAGAEARFAAAVVRTAGIVVKEAMTNSARHAGPEVTQTATVRMDPGLLRVIIADDGCGFDTAQISNRWGLRRLPRQVERVGGKLQISSTRGHGTVIEMLWVAG
ncbi:sensor histidine kinase [Nocardia bovistercoris]|uniref:histidine kinase n=1 Tax=Nocardia bovistercoris TaxID=2785916 RepID=A0A931IGZ2_9NOCA|nr:ATP-binding protein [Nocardia bovistercoris]MBH0779852.1 hypothetical protein [Nocardia bovistercoris]